MIRWLSKKLVNPFGNDETPTVLLVAAAFIAFAISGFAVLKPAAILGHQVGTLDLEALRPVPIYLVLSGLLLTLQVAISLGRSRFHIIYLFLTSGLALVFAGIITYSTDQLDFLAKLAHTQATYLVINVGLLVIFAVDAVLRHSVRGPALSDAPAAQSDGAGGTTPSKSGSKFLTWSADLAGLALLTLLIGKALDLLGALVQQADSPLVSLINRLFGTGIGPVDLNRFQIDVLLPGTNRPLADADRTIAIIAAIAALLSLVVAGLRIDTTNFRRQLPGGIRTMVGEILVSLRFVLSPLIWLIPAFLIALFSLALSDFYAKGRAFEGYLQLLLPFTSSLSDYQLVVSGVVLGAIAVVCVVLAVAIIESDTVVIEKTIATFVDVGLRFAVTYVFFLYSLALYNALLIWSGMLSNAPFAVGAGGTFAILLAVLAFVISSAFRQRGSTQTPSSGEAEKVPVGTAAQGGAHQPAR